MVMRMSDESCGAYLMSTYYIWKLIKGMFDLYRFYRKESRRLTAIGVIDWGEAESKQL